MNGRRVGGRGHCLRNDDVGVEVEVFTRSAIQQQLASEPAMPAALLIHWPSRIRVSNRLRTHCLVRICPIELLRSNPSLSLRQSVEKARFCGRLLHQHHELFSPVRGGTRLVRTHFRVACPSLRP